MDEHSYLRKGNKSDLVKHLGVPETLPATPDTIIIDDLQLFYHIAWPHGGPPDLISSIKARLTQHSGNANKIVVFDKYQGIPAKDHERMRCAGEGTIDYKFSVTSFLPKKKKKKKKKRCS